jgi:hypothetical protein
LPSYFDITDVNNSFIPIVAWGHSIVPIPNCTFLLNNVLVVPSLIQNLLYVCPVHTCNSCSIEFATVVYYDNMNPTYMTSSPIHHRRTKHIKIDIDQFVHENFALGASLSSASPANTSVCEHRD